MPSDRAVPCKLGVTESKINYRKWSCSFRGSKKQGAALGRQNACPDRAQARPGGPYGPQEPPPCFLLPLKEPAKGKASS